MAQWLRVFATLINNTASIPSTHMGCTAISISNPRGFNPHFWPFWASGILYADKTPIFIYEPIIFLSVEMLPGEWAANFLK